MESSYQPKRRPRLLQHHPTEPSASGPCCWAGRALQRVAAAPGRSVGQHRLALICQAPAQQSLQCPCKAPCAQATAGIQKTREGFLGSESTRSGVGRAAGLRNRLCGRRASVRQARACPWAVGGGYWGRSPWLLAGAMALWGTQRQAANGPLGAGDRRSSLTSRGQGGGACKGRPSWARRFVAGLLPCRSDQTAAIRALLVGSWPELGGGVGAA